jgi:hypothetical protein
MLEELNEAIVAKLSDNKKFDLAIGHFHGLLFSALFIVIRIKKFPIY